MPQRNSLKRLLGRRAWDEWDEKQFEDVQHLTSSATRPRRLAGTLVFAALFFAGAALSAGAGDQMSGLLGNDGGSNPAAVQPSPSSDASTTTDQTTTTAPASDPASAPAPTDTTPAPAPVPAPAPAPSDPAGSSASSAPDASAPSADPASQSGSGTVAPGPSVTPSAPTAGSGAQAPVAAAAKAKVSSRKRHVVRKHVARPLRPQAPEIEGPVGGATVWLNRAMPDPTPPASRLSAYFADHLVPSAQSAHLDWAFVLGVLRARGGLGARPASLGSLAKLESRLAGLGAHVNPWGAALSYFGQTSLADRAVALGHLYRAIGMDGVVQGLDAERYALARRVLNDKRVSIYPGGVGDIASGRVNVRVVAMIEYLADTFGQVTVSCLITGHGLYARPGVISAHIYGLAADISEVGNTPVLGHQQPGSVTQDAVRALLLLPSGMLPRQVISLLGLGGASFALADHYNHIHVGY
ncbi:MAG: hypothetical protein WBB74_02970 [Gaiellaceae bacterium]